MTDIVFRRIASNKQIMLPDSCLHSFRLKHSKFKCTECFILNWKFKCVFHIFILTIGPVLS